MVAHHGESTQWASPPSDNRILLLGNPFVHGTRVPGGVPLCHFGVCFNKALRPVMRLFCFERDTNGQKTPFFGSQSFKTPCMWSFSLMARPYGFGHHVLTLPLPAAVTERQFARRRQPRLNYFTRGLEGAHALNRYSGARHLKKDKLACFQIPFPAPNILAPASGLETMFGKIILSGKANKFCLCPANPPV